MEHRYFAVFKPYEMISQFVSPYEQRKLGALEFNFPEGTHAVGRLDFHSEGLLILTTDKSLTRKLMLPQQKRSKRYSVLVERKVNDETLEQLRSGLEILVKGKGLYKTQACSVNRMLENLPAERVPPYPSYGPYEWLEFILLEGKNRQIRKMCKAVRHECKRLIRTHIEDLSLSGMMPGEVKEYSQADFFRLLKIA